MTEAEKRAWYREFGQRIKEARRAAGLRQRHFRVAGLAGLWAERVCRIERGQVMLDVTEFCRLRKIIGTRIECPPLPAGH